jgi:hypothetical protein
MIRVAAGGIFATGGLFIRSLPGLIGSASNAATTEQSRTTLSSSSSRPSGHMAPMLPEIEHFLTRILPWQSKRRPWGHNRTLLNRRAGQGSIQPITADGVESPLASPCDISVTASAMPAAMAALDDGALSR